MPLDTTFFARFDSNTANNASLNFTGDPAVEITFDFDDTAANGGDLFLDANGGLPDDDTVVNIGGTDYNFIFDFAGTLPTSGQGVQQVPLELRGEVVYTIIVPDYPTAGDSTRLTFLPNADPTEVQMNDFGNGAINIRDVDENPPPAPVCFLAGTMIETPRGAVAVEDLKQGDLVITLDDGAQPIMWLSSTEHVWPGSDDKHKPIEIKMGALGDGLPNADLAVSPQHKMLLVHSRSLAAEFLAPAKGMTALSGVRVMRGKRQATYYHLMLSRHGVVFANGAPAESFFPGLTALRMLLPHQVDSLLAVFPALRAAPETGYGKVARPALTRRETEKLINTKNDDSLVATTKFALAG